MGQIFSWDAIRSGKIPTLESFQAVANRLHESLLNDSRIVSALILGSVTRGDFTIRSDVDCLVIYETAEEREVMTVMHELSKEAAELYVPVGFIPCDTLLAKKGLHSIGPSFIRHLKSVMGVGCIKGNVVDHLFVTTSVREEIKEFLRFKMYTLQESFAQFFSLSEERRLAFLRKAYEAPMHVARKVLIYEGILQGDSKNQVRATYRERMPPELSTVLENLLALDARYTEEVEAQVRHPNFENYARILEDLAENILEVFEFVRANISYVNSTVR